MIRMPRVVSAVLSVSALTLMAQEHVRCATFPSRKGASFEERVSIEKVIVEDCREHRR